MEREGARARARALGGQRQGPTLSVPVLAGWHLIQCSSSSHTFSASICAVVATPALVTWASRGVEVGRHYRGPRKGEHLRFLACDRILNGGNIVWLCWS